MLLLTKTKGDQKSVDIVHTPSDNYFVDFRNLKIVWEEVHMAKPIKSMPTLSPKQAEQLAKYLRETKPDPKAREEMLARAREATKGLRVIRESSE
jgi:hypothetical protein